MKVLVSGKNSEDLEPLVKQLGFEIVSENPEAVISYGGDGTLLSSERQYPSIPKLPIRSDSVSKKCADHQTESLLKNLLENGLNSKEYRKLETTIEGKPLLALNDFVIRNKDAIHSIRFRTPPDEKLIIGDGVVISTPYGSSGYFQSITGQTFDSGFGLAFNNTTEKLEPQFFNEEDQISFKLSRG